MRGMYVRLNEDYGLRKAGSKCEMIHDVAEELIRAGKAVRVVPANTGIKETPHIVKRSKKVKQKK